MGAQQKVRAQQITAPLSPLPLTNRCSADPGSHMNTVPGTLLLVCLGHPTDPPASVNYILVRPQPVPSILVPVTSFVNVCLSAPATPLTHSPYPYLLSRTTHPPTHNDCIQLLLLLLQLL
jgi:hypothetical protein